MKALRLQRFAIRLSRAARRTLGLNRTVYVHQRVAEYRSYWEAAAHRLGATFRAIDADLWEVCRDGVRLRIAGHIVPIDDPVTLMVAGDKELSYRFAAAAGVPVPAHLIFTLAELPAARAFLLEHGGPLVVKPVTGTSSGLGVTTHIQSWPALKRGALLASLYGTRLLVERMVPAESCRLLFLNGEFLHAVRRTGLRVTGDGRSSIRALLDAHRIRVDDTVLLTLAAQRLPLTTVPTHGASVLVRCLPHGVHGHSELRTSYTETITDRVAPALLAEARAVVDTVGAHFAGVDVITADTTRSLKASGGVFIEINTTPGIHHHYQNEADASANPVAVAVLHALLQQHRETRQTSHGALVPEGVDAVRARR